MCLTLRLWNCNEKVKHFQLIHGTIVLIESIFDFAVSDLTERVTNSLKPDRFKSNQTLRLHGSKTRRTIPPPVCRFNVAAALRDAVTCGLPKEDHKMFRRGASDLH